MKLWLGFILLFSSLVQATELPLVQKQQLELAHFTTQSGVALKQVKVGWEAYGKLNADKSNVILITHFFSGSSHAAGAGHGTDQVQVVGAQGGALLLHDCGMVIQYF